mgnify:CR=1 FL=1
MEKELKCKICKSIILLSIVIAIQYPICRDCSEKIKKQPDVPVEQGQDSPMRQLFLGGASASVLSTDSDGTLKY